MAGNMKFLVKPITAAVLMAAAWPVYPETEPGSSAPKSTAGKPDTANAGSPSGKGKAKPKAATTGTPQAAPAADGVTMMPSVTVTAASYNEEEDPKNERYYVPKSSTALKTDTPLMETPVSIQVVPQQVIKDQQVVRVEQATKNVSNVIVNNNNFLGTSDQFNIRGFNTGGLLFRDGFRFSTQGLSKRDPANLEQIEVLKGPASVLYGRIEPGGMVNLVTKKPLSAPYYDITQQVGSYAFYRTTIDATGPMTDDGLLGYRVNGAYENAGSFRQFLKNERFFVAPVANWNITPDTLLSIGVDSQQENAHVDSVGQVAICVRRDSKGKCAQQGPAPRLNLINLGEEFSTNSSTQNTVAQSFQHNINEAWAIRQQFNVFNAGGTNNVVFGDDGPFFDRKTQRWLLPRTLGGVDNIGNSSYFNSVNVIGKFDGMGMKHEALFGGDYYYEINEEKIYGGSNNYQINSKGQIAFDQNRNPIPCESIPDIDLYTPVHAGSAATRHTGCTISSTQVRTNWYGLYAQDQMDLRTYGIHLLGGLRYDNAQTVTDDQTPDPFAKPRGSVPGVSGSHNYRVNPRGGILWNPVDWFTAYGSYVSGFGAVNQGIRSNGRALEPELSDQWETGIKTEFLEGRFGATVAFFELTRSNISAADPANPLLFSILVGAARSRGVEIDLTGEILPGWRVIANYAYTEARLVSGGDSIARALAPVGNYVPNVPRNSGVVWTSYEFPVEDNQSLTFGGGITARGQRQGNYQNNFQIQGYATLDLMAAYKFKVGSKQLTAQLNVDNILDKGYILGGADFFRNRMAVGSPRSFLGMIRMEF